MPTYVEILLWLLSGYIACMIGKRWFSKEEPPMPGVALLLFGPVSLAVILLGIVIESVYSFCKNRPRSKNPNWWIL